MDPQKYLPVFCRTGNLDMVRIMISQKADVTHDRNYPLQTASHYGNTDIVKYLVSIGADPFDRDNYASILASEYGHTDTLKYLVSLGADVVTDNVTLRVACSKGYLDTVKYLVSVKADIFMYNNWAIESASKHGNLDIVEYLLSMGGDFYKLTPEHKEYFRMKRAYSKWRRIHFRKWIRRVLIPLYFSPGFPGANKAKKELFLIFQQSGT